MGNHYIVHSGPPDGYGQCAVTLVILKQLCTSLIVWKLGSSHMLTVCFLYKHGKMTVTVAYAATDVGDEDTKGTCYSLLQVAIEDISSHDISVTWLMPMQQMYPPCVIWCPNHISQVTHMLILSPMTMENVFSFLPKDWPLHCLNMVSMQMDPSLDLVQ